MNHRVHDKQVASLLADALRLYATRPRGQGASYDNLAVGVLGLSIGLALHERLQRLPGPRHGCTLDPPRGLVGRMPDANTIHVAGLILIRDSEGDVELGIESFQISAEKRRSRQWQLTRLLLTPVGRELWEAAV